MKVILIRLNTSIVTEVDGFVPKLISSPDVISTSRTCELKWIQNNKQIDFYLVSFIVLVLLSVTFPIREKLHGVQNV